MYNYFNISNTKVNLYKEMIIFKGLTHALIAVSLYSILFGIGNNLIIIIPIVLGSLIPDIDIDTSKLGRYNLFAPMMKHRGKMHTVLTLAPITIVLLFIDTNFALGFAFGYIMHLIFDTLTPMGIMWLYPYKKEYYTLAKRFNFKILEPLIVGVCILLIVALNIELAEQIVKIIMISYIGYGFLKSSSKRKRRRRLKW